MALTCARCGADNADGARFCSACGTALEVAGARERKLATIAFADLVGSTRLVEGRDPEDVRRMLDPFLDLARRTFEEHGGRVEKFIGDAAMAVFGVPQVHGDDPDRAVAAALALVDRLPEISDRLELRVGIETGEVLVEPGRADLAVTGDATYAAARLQQVAAPGEILVGERAAAGCRRTILSDPRTVSAKGFPKALVARAARAVELPGPTAATPFLGRGDEIERLRIAYLRTQRERRPTLAVVVGDAGVGKTRLVRELLGTLAALEPSPEVLVGRNPPYGEGIAFWALGEVLRAAARVPSEAGPSEIHAGLERRLSAVEPDRRSEIAATLVAVATGEGDAASSVSGALRLAWRRLLASVAAERPLVIAIDDAHWADEEFLDLIADSAATLNDHPILFVCTARPSLLTERPEFAEAGTLLELRALDPDAAIELAATLLVDGDAALARQVAARSGGNPFFAEEIARSLETGGGAGGPLPDTVQTAIASRLDALPPGEKSVLLHAAVLGDRFRDEALAALLEADPGPELASLAGRSLIHDRSGEESGLFSFHHQLIRDVAYESLPHVDRTRLHERAAAGIGNESVERHPELAEVIAFHLMEAAQLEPTRQRADAAFAAARRASTLAIRRGAAPRAEALLERAAALAPGVQEAVSALVDAADIAMMRVRGDEAYRLLRRAGEVAEEAGEDQLAAMKYALAVEVPTRSGGISGYTAESELTALLERSRRLVPEPGRALRAQLLLDESYLAWRFGRESEMGQPAREALELARDGDDVRQLSSALDAVAATSQLQERFAETVAYTRERLDALERVPREGTLIYERYDALWMLSEGLRRVGDLRGAVQVEIDVAPEFRVTAPHRAYAATLLALLHLGDWDRAIEYGMSVRSNWVDQGRPPFAPLAREIAAIGFLYGARDDEVTAGDWFGFAEEVAMGTRPLWDIRVLRADLALYRGDAEGALAVIDEGEPESWVHQLPAKRSEILATLGSDEAEAVIAQVEEDGSDDPLDAAVLLRARAALNGDPAPLREAVEILDRHDYAFEGARTRWLVGGGERDLAAPVFERLGAQPPA